MPEHLHFNNTITFGWRTINGSRKKRPNTEKPEVVAIDTDILFIGGGMACCGAVYEGAKWGTSKESVSPGGQGGY